MEKSSQQAAINADHSSTPGQFSRWYDRDMQLSELVRVLEGLSTESQTLFAFLLGFFSDDIVRSKGRNFFRELEWEKLIGIYKSKSGRRWYDREPVLQRAFNKLYSLSDADKAAIAEELHTPALLVGHYESFCLNKAQRPDVDQVHSILATSFRDGPEIAKIHYADFIH